MGKCQSVSAVGFRIIIKNVCDKKYLYVGTKLVVWVNSIYL